MAAIKIHNYQRIANFLTTAMRQISGVADYFYDAAYEVVLLNTFDPEIDLLSTFYNSYQSSQVIYQQAPQSVIASVQALQNHVLDKARTDESTPARFTDINDWIDAQGANGVGANVGRKEDADNSFKVEAEFAELSAQAGFTIEAENIL